MPPGDWYHSSRYEYWQAIPNNNPFFWGGVSPLGWTVHVEQASTVVYKLGYAKTSYVNENETQKPLEPWANFDPSTNKHSSQNWGVGMPETSSIVLLTGQNHINNR
jgi:hypothetical protein